MTQLNIKREALRKPNQKKRKSCPFSDPNAPAIDYKDLEFAKDEYALLGDAASSCLTCSGQPCQNACPKGIEISKWCAPTHRMLSRQIA